MTETSRSHIQHAQWHINRDQHMRPHERLNALWRKHHAATNLYPYLDEDMQSTLYTAWSPVNSQNYAFGHFVPLLRPIHQSCEIFRIAVLASVGFRKSAKL